MEERSQSVKARIAGGFYVLAVVAAVLGEVALHGKLEYAAGQVAVACYVIVTVLVYGILRRINKEVALLATILNLAGLCLEALRWDPGGLDVAMVFHGMFCVLMGWLILRSRIVPRILGALLVLAGLDWLLYLSPEIIKRASPYNSALGLLCEGLLFLWLLVMGVKERAPVEAVRQTLSNDFSGRARRGRSGA